MFSLNALGLWRALVEGPRIAAESQVVIGLRLARRRFGRKVLLTEARCDRRQTRVDARG